jgi:phage terminase large subunit
MLTLQLPKRLEFLLQSHRYKVAYGGRGGAKSWACARALLFQGWRSPLRILCAREFQSSIKDSVHKLLADQVYALGLEDFYEITLNSIKGANGTEFSFEGLRHNVNKIKSYEGVDRCWVEEAQTVSKSSWETLIPTIRKASSEIWVTFNPELDSDETYERFVLNPPPHTFVAKVNWSDNPWFPDVLREEMETLKNRDPDAYLNIWEGHCRVTLDGAIYATELREATDEGRITRVAYDHRVPVHTFWDLGFSDCTSIWFAQKVGFDYHIIDFYQNRLQKLSHYLEKIQNRGYVYAEHYLPHDADHETLAAPSISKQMKDVGHKVVTVQRIPDKKLGINATKSLFNRLWFDEQHCKDGLQALRHYRYDINEHGQWAKEPLHDDNSHAADALRTLGECIGLPRKQVAKPEVRVLAYSKGDEGVAWMG